MKLSKVRFLLIAVSVSVLVAISSTPRSLAASAQGSVTKASNVSDRDLKAFAKAYVEYHQIKRSYEPKLKTIKDEKIKRQIEKEGNDKVLHALEKEGLTPQQYNQLFAVVNRDARLRQKALSLIEAERRKS
jgi:Domain of unknown function (DUF4168)